MQEQSPDGMNGITQTHFLKGAFPMKSYKRVASAVLGMAMAIFFFFFFFVFAFFFFQ